MLTVFLARVAAPFVFDLREAVRDWTATGMLTGSVWIDAEDVRNDALDTPCVVVEPGSDARTSMVRSVLAADEQLRQVRLVSVQTAGDPGGQVDVDIVQTVRQLLAGAGVDVLRLNVVVPLTADPGPRDAPVMLSTPNVVLQPADGSNPAAPAMPIGVPAREFVAHAAGGLAVVSGLWAGQGESPYDPDQMWAGGGLVEMVRWYRRAVDGTTVWAGLRDSVAPGVGAPVPVDAGGRLVDVIPAGEVPSQLQRAHDGLLAATSSLTGPAARRPFVPPDKPPIGFLRALREFFAFLGSALANAPARWVKDTVDHVSRQMAAKATTAIYGRDADVQVMFNGRVAERAGGGEDIGVLSSAAADVAARLSGHLPVAPKVGGFADLFAYASTAMLDAGHRLDSVVPLPARGADPVVVGDARFVAPEPHAEPFRVPPGLGLPPTDEVVTPWSPYTAIRVRDQLVALEEEEIRTGGGRAGRLAEMQQARTRLDEWVGRQGAFTWMTQLTIARRLITARTEFAAAAEELRADPDDDGLAALMAQEARERRRVRWTLLFLPLVVIAIVLLGLFAPVLVAVVGGAVLFLGWAVALVLRVVAAQRLAWQMMYARDLGAARRRWLAGQVELMAAEVFRLGVAYACAESWSRVISGVVHRPSGVRLDTGSVAATAPDDTPSEMKSATGRFEPAAMAEMVNLVRRSVLTPGWLDVELRRRVHEIAVRLQREAGYDHPRQTFDDPGVDASRELVATASRINHPLVEQAAGEQFDARIRAAIEQVERGRGGSWALESITVGDANGVGARGTGGPQSAAEFLAPLDAAASAGRLPALGFAGGGDGAATVDAPLVIRTSGVGMSSLPGASGGTVFDRGVIRLDRGRRSDPHALGITPTGGSRRRDDDRRITAPRDDDY